MTFDFDALLKAVDWEATPLGCRSKWPRALESLLALLKRSRRPQYLVWGPDRRFFYNAAFLPVIGIKHPAGFGMPMAEVWPEVWEDIESIGDRLHPRWRGVLLRRPAFRSASPRVRTDLIQFFVHTHPGR